MSQMEVTETTNQGVADAAQVIPAQAGIQEGAQAEEKALDSPVKPGNDGEKTAAEAPRAETAETDKKTELAPEHTPAKSAEDIKLKLPEGFEADSGITSDFQELCVKSGLTPAQAQALVDWQLKTGAVAQERMIEAGQKALVARWGNNAEANIKEANNFFTKIDRAMGERLSKSAAGRAMANSAEFIELFHHLESKGGEDLLSGLEAAPVGGTPEVSKEDFYNKLFKSFK